MIKENEIRINNLVEIYNPKWHPKLKGVPLIVTGVNKRVLVNELNTYSVSLEHINMNPNTYYDDYSQFIEHIKPIILTEDWILKLGFKRLGHRKMWTKGQVCIVLMDYNDINRKTDGEVFYIGYKDMGNCIYHTQFELPYVHSLQNGYALTGEELKIKNE